MARVGGASYAFLRSRSTSCALYPLVVASLLIVLLPAPAHAGVTGITLTPPGEFI
jgi:hypothetical protein